MRSSSSPGRGGYPRHAYVEELDRYYHERIAEGLDRVPADFPPPRSSSRVTPGGVGPAESRVRPARPRFTPTGRSAVSSSAAWPTAWLRARPARSWSCLAAPSTQPIVRTPATPRPSPRSLIRPGALSGLEAPCKRLDPYGIQSVATLTSACASGEVGAPSGRWPCSRSSGRGSWRVCPTTTRPGLPPTRSSAPTTATS